LYNSVNMITYGQAQSPVHSILNTMTKCELVLKKLMGVNGVYLEVCFPNQTSKSNQQIVDQIRKLKKVLRHLSNLLFRQLELFSSEWSHARLDSARADSDQEKADERQGSEGQTNKPHCNKKRLWRSNKHCRVSIFGCTCDCWEHFFLSRIPIFFSIFFLTSQRHNFFS